MMCPKCGHEVKEGSKFCKNCGSQVESKCPKCGNEVKEGSKFCKNCGNPIESKFKEEIPPIKKYQFTPNTETFQEKPEGLLSIIKQHPVISAFSIVLCSVVLWGIFSSGGSKSDNPKSCS